MRVRGDVQPSNAFTVEEQPKKPGFCLVRFFENPQEFSEKQGELTVSGWEYDEYHLELPARPDMQSYIENHLYELKAEAKGGASAVTQMMAQMEAYNTANQLAIAELAEAMMGGAGNG